MKIEMQKLEDVVALVEHLQKAEQSRAPKDDASVRDRYFYTGQMAAYTFVLNTLKDAFVSPE